jgi:hypothetical protein
MKRVYFNEIRSLRPHLRDQFLRGRRQYQGQEKAVEFESAKTQEILSGELKHHGGYRIGILPKRGQPQK